VKHVSHSLAIWILPARFSSAARSRRELICHLYRRHEIFSASGIFPDHLSRFAARHQARFSGKRTLKDYEQQGSRFFRVAARETDQSRWRPPMEMLAEKFTLARWALNTLSDRYLKAQREHYFWSPNSDT
jgi:hypothetical protein